MLRSASADAHRLPAEDPHREGLRRRDRDRRSSRRPRCRARLGNRVLLKREDQQPVFSFKLRGAYNKMAHLSAARARARRDRRLGRQPRAGRRARGAAPRLHGDHRDAGDHAAHQDRGGRGARRAGRAARRLVLATPTRMRCELQKKSGATFVHPYDDPDVIAGQGTIGMEILRQWQGPLDAIFVAIGGGGLIARHRGVREARAAGDQDHRRAAGGFRRDGALARGGPARDARRTSACSPTASR